MSSDGPHRRRGWTISAAVLGAALAVAACHPTITIEDERDEQPRVERVPGERFPGDELPDPSAPDDLPGDEVPIPEEEGGFPEGEEPERLATYEVRADRLVGEHADKAAHEKLWSAVTDLVPQDARDEIRRFVVSTDGPDGISGAVAPIDDDLREWELELDPADADDPGALSEIIVHELGHLLTLNTEQVEPALVDDDARFEAAEARCRPRFFTGEGCSRPGSYLDAFVSEFWSDLLPELREIEAIEDDDEYYERMDAFYEQHRDRFVTDYAVTNPGEDIAESWAMFVLGVEQPGGSVAAAKVDFFEQYPELVELRDQIRSRS